MNNGLLRCRESSAPLRRHDGARTLGAMQPSYQPTQAPKSPVPTIAIVLGAVGCLSVVFLGIPFAAGIGMGLWGVLKARPPLEDPRTVPLTQTFTTPNGLLTAHYPADFAAKAIDTTTLMVSRNVSATENELVALAAVPRPITNDVQEIARLFEASTEKLVAGKGGTYTMVGQHASTCLGGRPGWQVESTYTLPLGGPYKSQACYFIDHGVGYEARYDVPSSLAARDGILLERILDATELQPPAPPPDPNTVPLTEVYATPNGMLTAHYPADFAASALDGSTVVLSRSFEGADGDVVTLGAVSSPVTKDVREFARILHALTEKKVVANGGGAYTRTSERAADCLGSHPGLEIAVSYNLPPVGEYVSYSCFFIEKNRGYVVRYDLPAGRVDDDVTLLRRVVDATVLAP